MGCCGGRDDAETEDDGPIQVASTPMEVVKLENFETNLRL
jgi:hypothetical protein